MDWQEYVNLKLSLISLSMNPGYVLNLEYQSKQLVTRVRRLMKTVEELKHTGRECSAQLIHEKNANTRLRKRMREVEEELKNKNPSIERILIFEF